MSAFSPRLRERGRARARGPLADRDFLLLLAATLGMFANHAPLLSVVPLWAAEGGSAHSGVGTTTAVTMATTVAIQLCMGRLLRRFGPYRLLVVGALLLGVPTFGYPLSTDLGWVLSVSAVRGLGFGIVTVAGSALVADLTTPAQRGRAVGWHGIAVGLPQVVLLPLGVWFAESFGFTAVFLAAGASSALVPLLVAGMRRRRAGGAAPERDGTRPAAGLLRSLAVPGLLMVVSACALGGVTSFLPLAVAGSTTAPAALFALSAAMIAGRWAAGAWSDRGGAGRLLVPGTVLCAAGMGGLAAAVATSPVLAVAAAALYGFGFGVLQNDTLVVMFHRAGPGGSGTASATWNVAFDAGTGAGSASTGLLAQALAFPGAYSAAALLVAAAVPFAWYDARRERVGRRTP